MTIRRYKLDFDRQILEVELADGSILSDQVAPDVFGGALDARQVAVDVVNRELTLTLPLGNEITFELGAPGAGDTPPSGRPVVYLDQLHWITLAQQLWSPKKVPDRDRASAVEIIELAQERLILLPFSAAHLTEAPVFGKQRRDLVTTVFALSRGWQMRNPVEVRRRELLASFSGEHPVAGEVVTLQPDALFIERTALPGAPTDFTLDLQKIHQRLTSVSALYAAMIGDGEQHPDQVREMAERWARSHHELALYMREHKVPKEHARLNARARLMSDLREELASAANTAGIGAEVFGAWLEHSFPNDLPRMPYLGRLQEVLFERLRNADDKWEANDLVDMHFLSCAAGYADIVVGEKKASELLRRAARRVESRAYVCRTLAATVDRLRTLGVEAPGL